MTKPPTPRHESERLAALQSYQILDTPEESAFNMLVQVAAEVCETPIAMISLIDERRQWMKAKVGVEAESFPRDLAFCAHAIAQDQPFVVPDALDDVRFKTNPFVTSDPHLRFYAGIPLKTQENHNLGTLCVFDYRPRELTPEQVERLQSLARKAVTQLELRRSLNRLIHNKKQWTRSVTRQRPKWWHVVSFVASLGLVVSLGVTFSSQRQELQAARQDVLESRQSVEVLQQLNILHDALDQAEFTAMLYLQTQDPTQLTRFSESITSVQQALQQLQRLSDPSSPFYSELDQLDILIRQELDMIESTMVPGQDPAIIENFKQKLQAFEEISGLEQTRVSVLINLSDAAFQHLQAVNGSMARHLIVNLLILGSVAFAVSQDIRLRGSAEKQLRQDRDFTTAVLETAGALVCVYDTQGRIQRFNRTCELTSGYIAQEVQGCTPWEVGLINEKMKSTLLMSFQDLSGPVLIDSCQYNWYTKFGESRCISWSNTGLFKPNGSLEYVIATGIDVTEQKEAELLLHKSQQQVVDLLENANDLIQSVTPSGQFLYVNPAWLRTLGYHSNDIPTLTLSDICAPETGQAMIDLALSQDPHPHIDLELQTKSGDWIRVEGSLNCKYDNGTPQAIQAILRDVTERDQAHQLLLQQTRRSQLLAEISLKVRQSLDIDVILQTTVDEIRSILKVDRVFVYHQSYPIFTQDPSPDEANQNDLHKGLVITESVVDPRLSLLGYSFTRDNLIPWVPTLDNPSLYHIKDYENNGLTPEQYNSQKSIHVKSALVTPLFLKDLVWGFLIVHACVDQREWLPFECSLLSQLADQVGIAITQAELLTQEQRQTEKLSEQNHALELARQEAERAVQTKSTFLATMSHEIRTPMNAVLGMAELLAATNLSDEQQDYLEIVRRSGDALLGLINQILDFSKLEAGQMTLEIIDFDLRTCLDDVVDLVSASAHGKTLELNVLIPPSTPTQLRGDVTRLRQVLLNLMSNAVKFTPMGEVFIEVICLSDDTEHVVLQLIVQDTGIGIAPEALSRLFQPFNQLDDSTTRKYGGTGLGLAISKQLVTMMNGSIGASSTPNEGTRFLLTLPFAKQKDPTPVTRSLEILGDTLSRTRILISDQQANTRRALHYLLESTAHQVIPIEDVSTLLQITYDMVQQSSQPLLIFVDSFLPDPEQEILVLRLRQDPLFASTRLILLGTGPSPVVHHLHRQGYCCYLPKPVTRSRVHQCLLSLADCGTPDVVAPRNGSLPGRGAQNSPIKLLVVEDNIVNQKLTIRQLKSLGYEATAVNNGREALTHLENQQYPIILMDCQMPELDGFDTTRLIREREGDQRHTIIIALTANAMPEDREMCLAAGMDDYLSKPVSSKKLVGSLDHWMQVLTNGTHEPPVFEQQAAIDWSARVKEDSVEDRPPINRQQLKQVSGGDRDFEVELIQVFLDDARSQIPTAQQLLVEKDWPALQRLAHRLKGASANIGAEPASLLARQLEMQARDQASDESMQAMVTFCQKLADIEAAIANWT